MSGREDAREQYGTQYIQTNEGKWQGKGRSTIQYVHYPMQQNAINLVNKPNSSKSKSKKKG
jgi:hypothetical protein